jgi:predicted dehydrogenase
MKRPSPRAPNLPYLPRDPRRFRPRIGLIGCGGITAAHLRAYRKAGYAVVALCDVVEAKARERQREFYPKAAVSTDPREVLAREDVDVVDLAPHPAERAPLIEAALRAGKHVLSQKPFVLDLDFGERMVRLAERRGLKLAVNQNGRWAPHFSWARHAIRRGLIGDVVAAHLAISWDHNWVRKTHFNTVRHIVLYDFAIHWFDILSCFMGDRRPRRVYASFARSAAQAAAPPLLGQAAIEYEGAQATLTFDADTRFGKGDTTRIVGSRGAITSAGPDLGHQRVTLHTKAGSARPRLQGTWFTSGFHGSMAELLCAIEEKREPSNSARDNLRGLALCFAAVASAETARPQVPGKVRRLPRAATGDPRAPLP